MINRDIKAYDYFTFGSENSYGQAELSKAPIGKIRIAIYLSSQAVQDNINYEGCQYVGLTQDTIDSSYVIQYGLDKLKVLYVNPTGRIKQVFLSKL